MPTYLVGGALLERVYAVMGTMPRRPIRVGRTDTKRDFVAVEDVVDGLMRLLACDESGEIYNLASGRPTEIAELLRTLIEIAGTPLTAETDATLVRATDVATSYGSNDKARARCGFTASVSLEQALRAAWDARCQVAPT